MIDAIKNERDLRDMISLFDKMIDYNSEMPHNIFKPPLNYFNFINFESFCYDLGHLVVESCVDICKDREIFLSARDVRGYEFYFNLFGNFASFRCKSEFAVAEFYNILRRKFGPNREDNLLMLPSEFIIAGSSGDWICIADRTLEVVILSSSFFIDGGRIDGQIFTDSITAFDVIVSDKINEKSHSEFKKIFISEYKNDKVIIAKSGN